MLLLQHRVLLMPIISHRAGICNGKERIFAEWKIPGVFSLQFNELWNTIRRILNGGEKMVSIIEVKTKKQLRCFVDYPNQLYRDVEQFVPATYGDDLEDWDRSKNPAFAYCDARCWLAYRDGEGASAPFSAARPTKNGAPTDCALRRWILSTIRRCRAHSSPRSKTGRVSSAAPPYTGRWASRTWTARAC